MKIPNKVSVGPFTLKVKVTDDLPNESWGNLVMETGTISIKKSLDHDQQKEILLHEMCEGLVRYVCYMMDEKFTHKNFERFNTALYGMLKDNKLNFGE